MHKQHEDQPSNELPDLSTWHRVQVGATIPKGTPYAYACKIGINVRPNGPSWDVTVRNNSHYTHYTESPIGPPRPTEEGATILASNGDWPPSALLIREGDRWVTCFGVEWPADQIRAWCPVTLGLMVPMR